MSDSPPTEARRRACDHCGLPVPGRAGLVADGPAFCCAGCRVVHSLTGSRGDGAQGVGPAVLRLGLGLVLTMNVMVFSFPFHDIERTNPDRIGLGAQEISFDGVLRWLLLLLATPVVVGLGAPVFGAAWDGLRRGRVTASLLVGLAAAAAWTTSLVGVLRGAGPLYFDSACMVLVLVAAGAWLEASMKARAARVTTGRLADLPPRARRLDPDTGRVQDVEADALEPGASVLVHPDEIIPADGIVRDGRGSVVEGALTGESVPRAVGPGDEVWAGARVAEGDLAIETTATGTARRVERLVAILDEALRTPSRVQRLADRVAAIFVPAVLVVAIATTLGWWLLPGVDGAEAIMHGLAVVLIACPCALGLAAPLATWTAVRDLAARGIVVRRADAVERGAATGQVLFDKTGTLTTGRFELDRVVPVGTAGDLDELRAVAAALEAHSRHPIASAFIDVEPAHDVRDVTPVPGLGMRGTWRGRSVALETHRPDPADEGPTGADALDDVHPLVLRVDDRPAAVFGVREHLRPDAASAIERLRDLDLPAEIVTGDSSRPAATAGRRLGIPVRTGVSAESKREAVRDARGTTRGGVALVGDGINDTPALAEADLGIAMASGADLARLTGDVVILDDRLDAVAEFTARARWTHRRIALALGWAFTYNGIGILLAVTGRLGPVFAAAAMVVSSVIVIVATTTRPRSATAPEQESDEATTSADRSLGPAVPAAAGATA